MVRDRTVRPPHFGGSAVFSSVRLCFCLYSYYLVQFAYNPFPIQVYSTLYGQLFPAVRSPDFSSRSPHTPLLPHVDSSDSPQPLPFLFFSLFSYSLLLFSCYFEFPILCSILFYLSGRGRSHPSSGISGSTVG